MQEKTANLLFIADGDVVFPLVVHFFSPAVYVSLKILSHLHCHVLLIILKLPP